MTSFKEVSEKIISALLIAAILFLFNSINDLKESVNDLSQQLAVAQSRTELREKNLERDRKIIDKAVAIVNGLSKRVDKLEWDANKQAGQANQ